MNTIVGEDFYRTFYESAPAAFFTLATDGKLIRTNKEFHAIMGRLCAQSVRERKLSLLPPPLLEVIKNRGKVTDFEVEIDLPDCEPMVISVTARFDEESQRIEGSLIDVTYRSCMRGQAMRELRHISHEAKQRAKRLALLSKPMVAVAE